MEFLYSFPRRHFKGEDRGGIQKCWLFSQAILTCSSIVCICILYFIFLHLTLITSYQLQKMKIILNRRGEQLGRLILYIMTKKIDTV